MHIVMALLSELPLVRPQLATLSWHLDSHVPASNADGFAACDLESMSVLPFLAGLGLKLRQWLASLELANH